MPNDNASDESNSKKRKVAPSRNDCSTNHLEAAMGSFSDDDNEEEEHGIGTQVYKQFDDGEYYLGSVISGPSKVKDSNGEVVKAWRVRYKDNDEEDLLKEELQKWACVSSSSSSSGQEASTQESERAVGADQATTATVVTPSKKPEKSQFETAKADLCYLMGVTEEEVVAALKQMKPPYGLNAAMKLIHKAKDDADSYNPQDQEKFKPEIGLKIRKFFDGTSYNGTVTANAEWREVDGEKVRMWEVTYNDDDKEDMDFFELMRWRDNRPTRPHPVRGRQLCSLELFSGCGALTQEFAEHKWRVRSIDNSPTSYATDKVDIMKIKFENIGFVPDFIHASPPCHTYSNMAGGYHRSVELGQFEKTAEARQHNRIFAQMAYIMRWAKLKNPHLIVTIENPAGCMSKMPLMEQLTKDLGLYSVLVNYCALGRNDKKPTYVWSNDFKLISTLSKFKCSSRKCPFYGGVHPIGARGQGHHFNAAAIPRALAEEVADHVHTTFYERRIRYTDQVELTEEEEEAFNNGMATVNY